MERSLTAPLATACASAAEPSCYHCGLPVPEPDRYVGTFDGRRVSFCCPGCESVAEAIRRSGLGAYYAFRTEPSRSAAVAPADDDLVVFDRPDVQAAFVESGGGAEREATLMLEDLHCAACVWLTTEHARRLDGVLSVGIDLSTRRARLRWNADQIKLSRILAEFAAIGYRAHPYDNARAELTRRRERESLVWQLFVAGFGMMQVMMYVIPAYLSGDGDMTADVERLLRIASLILTIPVVTWSALPFYRGAWRDARRGRMGMDTPIALGILIAFSASAWATFSGTGEVWFDSVTMFIFLLLAGRYLEMLVHHRASRAAEELSRARPGTTLRLTDYPATLSTERIGVTSLARGDCVLVNAGEPVPADGTVLAGDSRFDESLLTGESRPVKKAAGAAVIGGTLNCGEAVIVRIERMGPDTWLAGIERMIMHAGLARPRLARLADRYASVFVTLIVILAALAAGLWWVIDPSKALPVAVAILIVTCPCALSLATPVALSAAAARLARQGVLVTDPDAIEKLARVQAVVFDKTGSLTTGRFSLEHIAMLGTAGRTDCLSWAAALERNAIHPIARALIDAARSGATANRSDQVHEVPSAGVEGIIDGRMLRIGSVAFVRALHGQARPPEVAAGERSMCWLGDATGWLARFDFSDPLRPDATQAIGRLRALGAEVSMLSGDDAVVVAGIARTLSLTDYAGGLAPQAKLTRVAALQSGGTTVAMVGDGVNDSPAFACADVSIALPGAAPLAQRHASVILLTNRLMAVPEAIQTARRSMRIVRQNLAWALGYNLACVPLAAMGLVPPWLAGLGMATSALVVLLNAARLAPRAHTRATGHRSGDASQPMLDLTANAARAAAASVL